MYKSHREVYGDGWSRRSLPQEDDGERNIQMQVSSKHLSLASPYWRVALSEMWRGQRQPGKVTMHEVQEFDLHAMVTLMNVIHGHGHKVSRGLSLEQIVRFAIVMDYFQCAEICSPYTEIWMDRIMQSDEKHSPCLQDNLKALWAFNLVGHEEGIAFFTKWSIRTMYERPAPPFLPGTKDLIREIFHDQTRVQEETNMMFRGGRFH